MTIDKDDLDRVLRTIELPGEDAEAIRGFLSRVEFVDRVMVQVAEAHNRLRKAVAWAAFAGGNIGFLAFLGTNNYMMSHYFAVQQTLQQFFFLFLSISAVGGIFGFILTIDTDWLKRWTNRHV